MGKALYRKYRSKSLSEVVGQDHITRTLENALKNDTISHAYLFTGPHGVGKTSIARILAHAVNDFPYDEAATPVDIIEIDAASNRRIDEMRDLRDKVNIAPVAGKYKVYIIDEVHMLTREAFNALLKTLEEPPQHVIFILATTEAHKLPDTIVSRTQRHTFRPIEQQQVIDHLRFIADKEKLDISDDALALIAQHGQGSFRDSISLLDQISQHAERVEAADVQALLGIPPKDAVASLLVAVQDGAAQIFQSVEALKDAGYDGKIIAHELSKQLRAQLVDGSSPLDQTATLQLLQALLSVEHAAQPFTALELALLEANIATNPSAASTIPDRTPQTPPKPAAVHTPVVSEPVATVMKPKKPAASSKPEETAPLEVTTSPEEPVAISDFSWDDCLNAVRQKYNTLYGVLRMAQAEAQDDTLTLTFRFGFHQKKINDKKNKQLLSTIIRDQCGRQFTIETAIDTDLVLDATPSKPVADQPKPVAAAAPIDTISNIFGGAEVLE